MPDTFLDSNVLVYAFDNTDLRKQHISDRIIERALKSPTAAISFQVVQESLNVITQKLPAPMTAEGAKQFLVDVLWPLCRIFPSGELYERALDLKARYRYSFYDSLIIAAALEAGCTRLYSEDLQDGQEIEGLRIENPFRD